MTDATSRYAHFAYGDLTVPMGASADESAFVSQLVELATAPLSRDERAKRSRALARETFRGVSARERPSLRAIGTVIENATTLGPGPAIRLAEEAGDPIVMGSCLARRRSGQGYEEIVSIRGSAERAARRRYADPADTVAVPAGEHIHHHISVSCALL